MEPQAGCCRILREQRPNSRVCQAACCAPGQRGTLTLHLSTNNSLSGLKKHVNDTKVQYTGTETVQALPLDEILAQAEHPAVDFISIDVEGLELEVLEGLDLEKHQPPLLVIEDHLHSLKVHFHLRRHGYKLVKRTGCNSWYVPRRDAYRIGLWDRIKMFRKVWLGTTGSRLATEVEEVESIGRQASARLNTTKAADMAREKLPISVCVISGAEAGRIGRMLASVAGWTSEIVVVLNDGVEDGTEGVAASFGAKVFRSSLAGIPGAEESGLGHAGSRGCWRWMRTRRYRRNCANPFFGFSRAIRNVLPGPALPARCGSWAAGSRTGIGTGPGAAALSARGGEMGGAARSIARWSWRGRPRVGGRLAALFQSGHQQLRAQDQLLCRCFSATAACRKGALVGRRGDFSGGAGGLSALIFCGWDSWMAIPAFSSRPRPPIPPWSGTAASLSICNPNPSAMRAAQISLIISTYERPGPLDQVFQGVQRQSEMPGEILIADDGSGPATRELIGQWQKRLADALAPPLAARPRLPQNFDPQPIRRGGERGIRGGCSTGIACRIGSSSPITPRWRRKNFWVQGRRCFVGEKFAPAFSAGSTSNT